LTTQDTQQDTDRQPARLLKKGSRRRERILNAAASQFIQFGYAAASVRAIADEAGIGPSSLYYYFASKEDLLVAVHEEGLARIHAAVSGAIEGIEEPWDRLEAACIAHLEALLEGGVIFKAVMRELPAVFDQEALDRIRLLRQADKLHDFSLVVRDLSEIATYARVDNWAYRLLKHFTPGPYTFILKATREVPNRLKNPRKKTIGIRVPDHPISQALLEALGEPMMSSTLLLPGDDVPMTDPVEIAGRLGNQVDAVVDGGPGGMEPSSVLDLTEGTVHILRRGIGDVSAFE